MRVVDDRGTPVPIGTLGEIQVRGHNVMKGYWNSAAFGADDVVGEWFSTGDIGRVDADGYFFLVAQNNT